MSKHTLMATIGVGDPDLGAEVECKITFEFRRGSPDYWNKSGGHWEQGWDAEVEFLTAENYCLGKPSPFYGAYADMEQSSLDAVAESWLESDDGQIQALETVASDHESAREYAAELRADR